MNALALGIAVISLVTPIAHAQIAPVIPFTGDAELNLTMTPQHPRAGETVRFSIDSYSVDLDRSTITWYANDKEFARGDGLKEAEIVAGELGSSTLIEVFARGTERGGKAEARIRPVEVEILWSSDSYVPPFYKGRALPGTSGTISAYALVTFERANGVRIAERDIIYTWYRKDTRLGEHSGRGKSSITLTSPARFEEDVIRVIAESVDGQYYGEASVTIPRKNAELHLYENHPLFGILFHRAIVGEVTTSEREQRVSVFPYFLNIFSPRDASLSYEWKVNDIEGASDATEPNTISITTNNFTGPARIQLALSGGSDIFLRATGMWSLVFSDASNIIFDAVGVFGN